jgi:hypothetical protein
MYSKFLFAKNPRPNSHYFTKKRKKSGAIVIIIVKSAPALPFLHRPPSGTIPSQYSSAAFEPRTFHDHCATPLTIFIYNQTLLLCHRFFPNAEYIQLKKWVGSSVTRIVCVKDQTVPKITQC